MTGLRLPLLMLCVAAASASALADTIVVDGAGGGDYLTIQEAVDSAAVSGDTVLVLPGVYTDLHQVWDRGLVNVYCSHSVALMSSGGPDVTILDGGGLAAHGVFSDYFHVVVEGFTIRNGCMDDWYCSAITIASGEARGNVCSGYGSGVGTLEWWYVSDRTQDRCDRNTLTIDATPSSTTTVGSTCWTHFGSSVPEFLVSGNTVSNNVVGVLTDLNAGDVTLVGNTISANTRGVEIRSGSFSDSPLTVSLENNDILDNTGMNIYVLAHDSDAEHVCDVTIGGSSGAANNIHGSPVNLSAEVLGYLRFTLDATYNFWGSVACTTFVPLFDIDPSVPDSAFTFEPFMDEAHAQTYDCQGVPVLRSSWGSIKALYQ